MRDVRIATQQRVAGEGPAFAFIISVENDEAVLDRWVGEQCPQDQRQGADEVLACRRAIRERRREDVEWRGSNISVDDTDRLICQEKQLAPPEDLALLVVSSL